jgi:hypothetical protein
MATIEIYGPSSHEFDGTVGDIITARAEVANNGDFPGWVRIEIEGSPSATGDLTQISPNSTAIVTASARLQTFMENTRRTLTARLIEYSRTGERVRELGVHSQAVALIAPLKPPPKAAPKPGASVRMWAADGTSMMVDASLVDEYLAAGWSLEEIVATTTVIVPAPVGVTTPVVTPITTTTVELITAYDSVNLTELEKLDEGYFFVEERPLQIDTVELTEAEKLDEGYFFVDALPTTIEEAPQYTGPIDFPQWTPPVDEYVFHLDVADTMEGRIIEFEADSPYTGITTQDILDRIRGDRPDPEPFELAPVWEPPPFELAPVYYQEEEEEEEQFVDEFQEAHDYFEEVGAYDPVYEEVVIYEEDDGYVWLDPEPVTYEDWWWEG